MTINISVKFLYKAGKEVTGNFISYAFSLYINSMLYLYIWNQSFNYSLSKKKNDLISGSV